MPSGTRCPCLQPFTPVRASCGAPPMSCSGTLSDCVPLSADCETLICGGGGRDDPSAMSVPDLRQTARILVGAALGTSKVPWREVPKSQPAFVALVEHSPGAWADPKGFQQGAARTLVWNLLTRAPAEAGHGLPPQFNRQSLAAAVREKLFLG